MSVLSAEERSVQGEEGGAVIYLPPCPSVYPSIRLSIYLLRNKMSELQEDVQLLTTKLFGLGNILLEFVIKLKRKSEVGYLGSQLSVASHHCDTLVIQVRSTSGLDHMST